MTEQEAILLLQDVVLQQKRHKYYFPTIAIAKEAKAFITGEGVDKYVPRFERREDEAAHKQRLEITINVTQTVCGNLIDPQYKLPRSNSIERKMFYMENDTKKLDELRGILNSFWDGKFSLDTFMGKSWVELNNIDPNTFIALDWKYNKDGGRIKPYPVEYPSENVINYNKRQGELEWVVVHRPAEGADPEAYILYTKDFTVKFRKKEDPDHSYKDITFFQEFPIKDHENRIAAVKSSDIAYFDVFVFKPHNLGFVPGFFVGFVTDMATRKIYRSAINKAIPILKKVVKSNSELDLILSLHTFPQKVQYVNPCPECNGNGRVPAGTVCDACEGKGIDTRDVHNSSQDVLYIPRPREKDDQMDLSQMVYYVKYDVELFKAVDAFVDKNIRRCKEAVYNSEVFSRGEVAETAYQKNIDLQNVYDALWPMAQAYAYTYNFIVDAVSRISKLDEGLVHNLSFRKDFKMKSLTDLYQDLLTINTSGADEFVKRGAEDDIAEILYEDNPRELAKYYTMNHFFPFSGKTKDEIKTIIANPSLTTVEVRTLWANFSFIFDELDMEYSGKGIDYYRMPREKQKEALDEKVAEMVLAANEEPPINIDYGTEEGVRQTSSEDEGAEARPQPTRR